MTGSRDVASLDAAQAAAIRDLLAGEGVDASYVAFVVRHVDRPDEQWRWCCGSQCDPCVERLARVVHAARPVLGRNPAEGIPAAPDAK